MIPDPTDEIRAIRDRLAAACDYDLDKIFEETKRHQAESGRSYLNLAPRRKVRGKSPNEAVRPSSEAERVT